MNHLPKCNHCKTSIAIAIALLTSICVEICLVSIANNTAQNDIADNTTNTPYNMTLSLYQASKQQDTLLCG